MSETIAGGLVKQIENFLTEHPRTNFVAIDTLQRVRDVNGEANAYANDYREVNVLKSLADKHRIAILLIHHLRKQADDDPLNMVSGTTGLREENILNPQAYFNQNNPDFYKSDYWCQPFDWHATSVRTILNNPVYLGKTVFGRTKTKGFYQKDRIHTDEEEWIVVDGTHEALVTQDTWDLVHKMMESRRRECRNGEIQMFAGLIKCAGCGTALSASYDAKKGKFRNFSCWVYKNYGKDRCSSHAIGWKTLQDIVLTDIRRNAQG